MDAILDGVETEMKANLNVILKAKELLNVDTLHEPEFREWHYVDDNTGEMLDGKKVTAARADEMNTFKKMNVYEYVLRETVKRRNGKLIGVRWVDILKGSDVRSRLVAQEFASDCERDDIFAGTPPLAATKFVLSDVASSGRSGPGAKRVMILDIKRAFLYGDIEEEIHIELPNEDPMKDRGYVGRLLKAMYGTRAAPQVWQNTVRRVMIGLGFKPSTSFPCVFFHRERGLRVVTHVDDFLCGGDGRQLRWLRKELEKEFELKHEVLGPDPGEVREGKFLGRRIRWTDEGIEYECDPSHAEVLIKEWDMEESKAVGTPGVAEEKVVDEDKMEDQELGKTEATRYRRAAARINYMALDRLDIGFAAKEVSRCMAKPKTGDVVRIKRVIRYLRGAKRIINKFKWQEPVTEMNVYTDSDWAGCTRTRRSTSGGIVKLGHHVVAHWSSTQATVALSSAEAELNSIVKSGSEAIGIKNMVGDCGREMKIIVKTDSSAANGITHRRGCGKVKHLEARQLWIQELVMDKKIFVQKVPRELNPSDALTHHWSAKDAGKHFEAIGVSKCV